MCAEFYSIKLIFGETVLLQSQCSIFANEPHNIGYVTSQKREVFHFDSPCRFLLRHLLLYVLCSYVCCVFVCGCLLQKILEIVYELGSLIHGEYLAIIVTKILEVVYELGTLIYAEYLAIIIFGYSCQNYCSVPSVTHTSIIVTSIMEVMICLGLFVCLSSSTQ